MKLFEISTEPGRVYHLQQLVKRRGITVGDLDSLDRLEVGEVEPFRSKADPGRVAFTVTRLEDVEA